MTNEKRPIHLHEVKEKEANALDEHCRKNAEMVLQNAGTIKGISIVIIEADGAASFFYDSDDHFCLLGAMQQSTYHAMHGFDNTHPPDVATEPPETKL